MLPTNISPSSTLEGVYSNNSDIDTTKHRGTTFWSILDYKSEIKRDSIIVKLDIINTKSIKLVFLDRDGQIGEKVIKGNFKDDKCFYTRRRFYIIPILPVLWAYLNEQKRIYRHNEELVVEVASNTSGAIIIMGGGNRYNDLWRFNQLKEK